MYILDCLKQISELKSGALACMQKIGSDACSCWSDSSLKKNVNKLKECDCRLHMIICIAYYDPNQSGLVSKESKSMAEAAGKCRKTFGSCRKLEDEVGLSIHACT